MGGSGNDSPTHIPLMIKHKMPDSQVVSHTPFVSTSGEHSNTAHM